MRRVLPITAGRPVARPALRALHEKNEAAASNNLAWLFCNAPGRSPEQTREAVTLADRAVLLEPNNKTYWNTLALGATG